MSEECGCQPVDSIGFEFCQRHRQWLDHEARKHIVAVTRRFDAAERARVVPDRVASFSAYMANRLAVDGGEPGWFAIYCAAWDTLLPFCRPGDALLTEQIQQDAETPNRLLTKRAEPPIVIGVIAVLALLVFFGYVGGWLVTWLLS